MINSFLMNLALSARTYPNYVLLVLFFVWGIALFNEGRKPGNDGRTFGWAGLFLWMQSLYQLFVIAMKDSRLGEMPQIYIIGAMANFLSLLLGAGAVWCALLSLKKVSSKIIGGYIAFHALLLVFWLIPADLMESASFAPLENEMEAFELEKKDVYQFDQYYLTVKDPGVDWKRYDVSAYDSTGSAVLCFQKKDNTTLLVACESLDGVEGATLEVLAEALIDSAREQTAGLEVLRKAPSVVNGVEGFGYSCSIDNSYTKVFADAWLARNDQFVYKVVVTGPFDRQTQVKRTLDEFLPMIQFHKKMGHGYVAENETVAREMSPLSPDDLRNDQYGINFETLDRSWNVWPKGRDLYPTSEMTFATVNEQYLIISPVFLPPKKLPAEAMFQSLLDLHGLSSFKVHRDKPTKTELGNAFRYEQTFWMKGDREGHRIYGRLVWTNNMAWIVHAEGMAVSLETQSFLLNSVKQASLIQPGGDVDFQNLTDREKKRQGLFFSGVGQYYEDIEADEQALSAYQAALSWNMDDEYYLLKVLDICGDLERYEEGLKTLELTGDLHRLSNRIQGEKAFLLEMLGHEEQAMERYAYAFDNWLKHDEYFERYLRLLVKYDQKKEAEKRARQYLKHSGSREVRLVLAQLLEETGAFEEAVSLLTIIETESIEYDPEIRMALARVYLRAGKYRDSYRILGELISRGHGTEDVFKLKEEADQYQDWIRQANETFEYAVSGASLSSTMTTEDNPAPVIANHFQGKEIVPVKITHLVYPEEMDASTRTHLYRIPLWLKAVVFRPDEEYRETTRISYEILNKEAVKTLSPLRIRYYPDHEDLSIGVVHFYNVKKQDIGGVDRKKITFHTLSETTNGLRQDEVQIPLPKLEANTFIELIYTIKPKQKPERLPVVTLEPDRSVPIGRVALLVDSASLPVSFSSPFDVVTENEVGIYRYTLDNLFPEYREPFQGASDDDYPLMIAADGSNNWDLVSSRYLAANTIISEGDARVYEIAQDLTKDCYSVPSKVEKLAVAVRDRLTFNAEPFGRYYQTADDLVNIMQSKTASALNHSLLFVRMADCVGIDAQLVFAHTDHDPIKNIYSLDQFNTVFVRVLEGRRERFLDLTNKDCSVALSIPLGFAGKEVFLLDPDNPRFIELPAYEEEENSLDCQRTVVYLENGNMAVEEVWTCRGYSKDSIETRLLKEGLSENETEFFKFFRRQVPTVNHLKVLSQAGVGLPEQPLKLTFEYDVLDVVNKHPGRWIGAPPGSLEGVLLDVKELAPRKLPFEIELPIHFTAKVVCQFPKGMKPSGGDLIPLDRKSPYVDWSVDYIEKNNRLEVHFEFQRHAGVFPAEEYLMYRQSVEEAFNSLRPNVLLVTE